jgi:hypothetical protein
MNRIILGLGAIAAVCLSGPASANFIQNGSFESGDFTDWTLLNGTGSGNTLSYAQSVDFVWPSVAPPYVAEDGTDFALLGDGKGTGATLSQTVTDSATRLVLSYWVATDGYTGNSFSVKWDGTTIAGSALTNDTSTTYTQFQFAVQGTGSDTLQFVAENTDGFWLLDNVTIQIPEPGSIALLGSGLIAAAGAFRHRRRRARKA